MGTTKAKESAAPAACAFSRRPSACRTAAAITSGTAHIARTSDASRSRWSCGVGSSTVTSANSFIFEYARTDSSILPPRPLRWYGGSTTICESLARVAPGYTKNSYTVANDVRDHFVESSARALVTAKRSHLVSSLSMADAPSM